MVTSERKSTKKGSTVKRAETRRKYKNPPITEAVCEIRFAEVPPWDITFPGQLYQVIRGVYPTKPLTLQQHNIELSQGSHFTLGAALTKVQFSTKDGRRMLSIAPGALSIHDLRPYSGWESFRDRISEGLSTYCREAKPGEVVRIGLRYINKITIPGAIKDLDEYFLGLPQRVDQLPTAISNFVFRAEFAYEDQPSMIAKVTFATAAVEENEDRQSFVLDVDVIWQSGGQTNSKIQNSAQALKIIERLRNEERTIFEALITDKTRSLFDE